MKPQSSAVAIGLLFMPIGGWATASEPGQPSTSSMAEPWAPAPMPATRRRSNGTSDEPQPFSITVRTGHFFRDTSPTVRLLQPVQIYDRAAHDKAFDSRDYAPLIRSTPLSSAADGTVTLPALAPWGVILVKKGSAR